MNLHESATQLLKAAADKPLSRNDLSLILADFDKEQRDNVVERLLADDLLVKMRIRKPGFVRKNTLFFISPEGRAMLLQSGA